MKKIPSYFSLIISLLSLSSIATAQVSQKAVDTFLNDSAVRTGHAGISIYEPATGTYLYNYNAEKNFMPSSNVKLFTLYAGMKYLGDSIVTARVEEKGDTLFFEAEGDPTFLHKDFPDQPFFKFLQGRKQIVRTYTKSRIEYYAPGWMWEDNGEGFMPKRYSFPIYGNVISFFKENQFIKTIPPEIINLIYFDEPMMQLFGRGDKFKIRKEIEKNRFRFIKSDDVFSSQEVPFEPTQEFISRILSDTLNIPADSINYRLWTKSGMKKFYSRPVDSLFRPMMFNSDNFFAEQTLLMVSNEKIGYMSDAMIIDSLLKNDFKDIPTKPRWVDGSGLSRYNLFSPKDFIYILNKLKDTFGLDRMKRILPGAGKGTLTNYYGDIAGSIYAKTGSMSNNVSLSGYLISKKGKILLFSVIINNFSSSGKSGRRAIEKLLLDIREKN